MEPCILDRINTLTLAQCADTPLREHIEALWERAIAETAGDTGKTLPLFSMCGGSRGTITFAIPLPMWSKQKEGASSPSVPRFHAMPRTLLDLVFPGFSIEGNLL